MVSEELFGKRYCVYVLQKANLQKFFRGQEPIGVRMPGTNKLLPKLYMQLLQKVKKISGRLLVR